MSKRSGKIGTAFAAPIAVFVIDMDISLFSHLTLHTVISI